MKKYMTIEELYKINKEDFPVYFETDSTCYVLFQDKEEEFILLDDSLSLTYPNSDIKNIEYVETNYDDVTLFSFDGKRSENFIYFDNSCEEKDDTFKNNVKEIANKLINKDGYATTLDVKIQLRDQGEQVNQKEVSEAMNDLYKDGVFDRQLYNGQYWIYKKNGTMVGAIKKSAAKPTCKCDDCNCGDDEDLIFDSGGDGDWDVYYSYNGENICYVSGDVTREKARWIGHKKSGLNYDDIRARQLK